MRQLLKEDAFKGTESDYCSETETEGGDVSDDLPHVCTHSNIDRPATSRATEDFDEDIPLASLVHQNKNLSKIKASQSHSLVMKTGKPSNFLESSLESIRKSYDDQESAGRKRIRVVISDDEADELNTMDQSKRPPRCPVKNTSTASRGRSKNCHFLLKR